MLMHVSGTLGPSIVFYDRKGKMKMTLTAEPAAAVFADRAGTVRTVAGVSRLGEGVLTVFNDQSD
jgi:hypothetical protein